jgi:hypothetical protein
VLLALAAAKSTVLLVFAAVLCLAFRRFSAATKHCCGVSSSALAFVACLSFLTIWSADFTRAAIGSKRVRLE